MSKETEGRDIGKYLKKVKKGLNLTNKYFTTFIQDEPDVIKGLEKISDHEIPLSVLYQLSWFANLKWRESCDNRLSEHKVENVMITRDLRDACDKEIMRRLKI